MTSRFAVATWIGASLLAAQPLTVKAPEPDMSGYYGSYRIAKPDPPPAFPDFQEFAIESIQSNLVRGRVLLREGGGELRFTSGSYHGGRLQFTTVRSADGVSYSFQGEVLMHPPKTNAKTPVLEGTLKLHRYGSVRAAGKLPFLFVAKAP